MFWDVFCKECDKINKKPNKVAMELGLSGATTTKWKAGTIPNGETLVKIADYFNISTDYLLGRTNDLTPTPYGNISGNNSIQANGLSAGGAVNLSTGHTVPSEKNEQDELSVELMKAFRTLTTLQKAEVVVMVNNMRKEA